MKRFFYIATAFLAVAFLLSCNNNQHLFKFPEPPREPGVKDVLELRCEPLDTVRIAFIGLGMRGSEAIRRYTFLEGVRVVALCDVMPENVDKANEILVTKGLPGPSLIPVPKTGNRFANGPMWIWCMSVPTGTCIHLLAFMPWSTENT